MVVEVRVVGLEDLAATYSPTSWDAVPLAQRVFTAEFGKGSGVEPLAMTTRSSKPTGVWWPADVCVGLWGLAELAGLGVVVQRVVGAARGDG